jgi:hypothetical protein
VVIRPDSEPSSLRAAARLDTPPGQQYQQVDHVFSSHPDIAEFLFNPGVYADRDVSCAKRESSS